LAEEADIVAYLNRDKQREYQNSWLKKRREVWLLNNGPCVGCGTWENLEIDHIDSMQKVSHRVWGWKEERRNKELEKCQILCWDCHLDKTWSR